MRQITITRSKSGNDDQGTFGTLKTDRGLILQTVELPNRKNQSGISCIPPGSYRCTYCDSPLHGMVWHVEGVKGRDAILIHSANFAGDVEKGYVAQVQGCIAPGISIAVFAKGTVYSKSHPPLAKDQRGVTASTKALCLLEADLRGETEMMLTITEA